MKWNPSPTLRLVIVVVVLTLVLAGMIGRKQWTLATGTPVVLETQPVDPRSLFRGDYVRLNYVINTLGADRLELPDVKRGDVVYVTLEKSGAYWQPVSVSTERPAGDDVAIKGHVERVAKQRWNRETRKMEEVSELRVNYGIENYFVPEGEGRRLERPAQDEKVSIEVAVDACGNAGIRAVLVNGQPRYVETLF